MDIPNDMPAKNGIHWLPLNHLAPQTGNFTALAVLKGMVRFARSLMRRPIPIAIIAATTAVAAGTLWFWALRPFGSAFYLTSTGASAADIVRQYWPHRLVEPEWVSAKPDQLLNWHHVETLVRLSIVTGLWLLVTGGAIYKFKKSGAHDPADQRN